MITQHTEVNTTCWTVHNILMVIQPNPSMKAEPWLPFSWIWKLVNYFVQIRLRFPWGASLLSSTLIFIFIFWRFWRWLILVVICLVPLLTLIKVETSSFIFLLGSGISGWTSNSSALYFSGFIHARYINFLKWWWDNTCFLGVPCMLRMNM